MSVMRATVARMVGLVRRCGLVPWLLLGCGPERNDDTASASSPTAASASAESSSGVPSDELQPYGVCNEACDCGYDEPCTDFGCSSCGGCGEKNGSYAVCGFNCETAADCPPPPGGGPVVCIDNNRCFIDCSSTPCPEGMDCVAFGLVGTLGCMLEGHPP